MEMNHETTEIDITVARCAGQLRQLAKTKGTIARGMISENIIYDITTGQFDLNPHHAMGSNRQSTNFKQR